MLFLAGFKVISGCFRWSHCSILLLIYSCTFCSLMDGKHVPTHQLVNSSNPIIDLSNYTYIELTLDCPVQYTQTQWYHDGKYLVSDRGSLQHVVDDLQDGGIFKCGQGNTPLETFSNVNVTIGRKPSQPQNLVCSGHLFDKASCSWKSGTRETNLPGTFIAQKKVRNAWVTCNDVSEVICNLDRTDGLRIEVRVKEVNELGSSKFADTYYVLNKSVRPFPPTDLTLKHSNNNYIILASWGTSEGWENNYVYLKYQLQFRPISRQSVWEQTRNLSFDIYQYEFEGWNYYTTYEVEIRAKHYDADGYGDWSEPVHITTKEGYPIGQLALLYKEMESEDKDKTIYRNVLLTWEVPDEMKARGKILGFEIKLLKWGVDDKAVNITDGNSTQYTFTNLLRDANYTMYVSAYNSISLSAPAILDVPLSLVSSSYQVVVAVMVCFVVIVVLFLLAIGWIKIKKTEICLPLPEPNFNISKWQGIPIASAYVEGEVFDEIRPRKIVPTKQELEKLMRKLPDPSLKDTILELLRSKCSIDHDWERMERRMDRLLSNNTEISFLSSSDEEEHLINNLSTVTENTALLNFNGEAMGRMGRCHSMPLLDKKITKDNNVKDVDGYSSGSEDTSGIGSDTSDQDVESEFHMKTSLSIADVKCSSSLPSTSVDNINVSKSKSLSEKHENAESLQDKGGYIKQNDVSKVVKSPANHQQNHQTTRQSSVSDYLDAAQMRQIQNHPRMLRQKRLMRRKPKSSGIGYVAVEDMPKIVAPKVPAGNIPKPSVYIQHRELPALLSGASKSKISKLLEVDQKLKMDQKSDLNSLNHKLMEEQQLINSKPDIEICQKVPNAECQNVLVKTEDTKTPTTQKQPTTLVSPYVKGSAKSSCTASNQSNTTDYVTLDTAGVSVSQNTKHVVLPKPDSANWTSLSQNIRNSSAMSKEKQPSVSTGLQNINKPVFPKQNTKNRRQESQNFKEITLSEDNPECKMSRVRIVNKSLQPKQSLQNVTTPRREKCEAGSSNVNRRALLNLGPRNMQRVSGQTSSSTSFSTSPKAVPCKKSEVSEAQDISTKAVPKQNVQANHSKDYVPIQMSNTMASSSTTRPTQQQKPRSIPASQRPCQKVVASKSHFQNQGVMMKGQFKSAKFVYSVSPSV